MFLPGLLLACCFRAGNQTRVSLSEPASFFSTKKSRRWLWAFKLTAVEEALRLEKERKPTIGLNAKGEGVPLRTKAH